MRYILVVVVAAMAVACGGCHGTVEPQTSTPLAARPCVLANLSTDAQNSREASLPWQQDFNLMATQVSEQFPDDYAVAAISEAGDTGCLGFKADAPPQARTLASTVPGVTIVENLGYSYAGINEVTITAIRAVQQFVGRDIQVYASGVVGPTIHLSIYDPTQTPIDPDAVASHLANQYPNIDPISLTIEVLDSPPTEP